MGTAANQTPELWEETPDSSIYTSIQHLVPSLLRNQSHTKIWKDAYIFKHWKLRLPIEDPENVCALFWASFFGKADLKYLNYDSLLAHSMVYYHEFGFGNLRAMVSRTSQKRDYDNYTKYANTTYPVLLQPRNNAAPHGITVAKVLRACSSSEDKPIRDFLSWFSELRLSQMSRVTAYVAMVLMRLSKQSVDTVRAYIATELHLDILRVVTKAAVAVPKCPIPVTKFLDKIIPVTQSNCSTVNSTFANVLICFKEHYSCHEIKSFLLAACLKDLSGAGLGLIVQMQELSRDLHDNTVIRYLCTNRTRKSEQRIRFWNQYYEYDTRKKNMLAPWCRTLDLGYLSDFDSDSNLLMVTRMIAVRVPYGPHIYNLNSNPWNMDFIQRQSAAFKKGVSDSVECIRQVINDENTELDDHLNQQVGNYIRNFKVEPKTLQYYWN